MKSVYACSKPDGTLALAIDIIAIGDPKTIGALLKLAGDSGFVIDRVDRKDVEFLDPALIRIPKEEHTDKRQLEMDFSQSPAGEGRTGPAEMGEGFSCTFSGPCPHENKSCASCEYAGSIFPKAEAQAEQAEIDLATTSEPVTEVPQPELSAEMQSSAFMQWATADPAEREATGITPPVAETLTEADLATDADAMNLELEEAQAEARAEAAQETIPEGAE